ncbi:MAG: hypothetical protein JW867_06610 [Candidatus Omnitrophica bacterium]|nr:hypothetical protein [Candidatus Omnitrophota bacterium]
MKGWPVIVAFLYGVIVLIILSIGLLIAFHPTSKTFGNGPIETLLNFYSQWQVWVFLAVMITAQACLLFLPVAIGGKKPIKRSLVFWPIVASGFVFSILFAGVLFAAFEAITKDPSGEKIWPPALGVFILSWIIWGYLFYRSSRKSEPRQILEKQMNLLFKGSILELLIAVPSHIYVRSKDYCCAGFGTFIGIAFGISVMIFSFGPGVIFLYSQRLARLKQKK